MPLRLQISLLLILCSYAVTPTASDKAHNPVAEIWEPYIASVIVQNGNPIPFEVVRDKLNHTPQQLRIPYLIAQLSDKRLTQERFTNTTGEPLWQQRVCDLAAGFITDYHPANFDSSTIMAEPLFDDFWFPESSPIEDRDAAIRKIMDWWKKEGRGKFRGRSITISQR
jgi:hypothetical protein